MYLKSLIDNSTRVGQLKRLIKKKGYIRVIEVHNGLSGLIANNTNIINGKKNSFDALWESSLTDSASKGLPDIELVSFDSRLETIHQILEVTTKPMIVDGDTGGDINHFEHMVKRLERAGISMVIIEDKVFPKRNSLADAKQTLENPNIFSEKIHRGVQMKQNNDFMIVARLESLIAGGTMQEALHRAKTFLEAGADGIMIHSKLKNPSEILEFSKYYSQFPQKLIQGKVLVCVPTTYNTITTKELAKSGFQIIIYANQLIRSAYRAMEEACKNILHYDRAFEVDNSCVSINQLFETVGLLEITKRENENTIKYKNRNK